MFSTLERTGGPWKLRTAICRVTCHKNGKTHNHSHGSFSALYRAIGIFARSGKNADALLLYNTIQSGDNEVAFNVAADCLVRLLEKGRPSSSARYSHFDDDESEDESASPIRRRLQALKRKKLFWAVLPFYVIFMIMVYETNSRGIDFTVFVQRKALDVLEDAMGYGTEPIMPPATRSCHTPPTLLSVDRDRPRHVLRKQDNLSYRDFRSLVVVNAQSVHIGGGYEMFWQEDSRRKDFQVKELAMWTDYVQGCVDPVLKLQPPVEQKLIILVGDSYTGPGYEGSQAAGGFYDSNYDFIFLRGASTVTRKLAIRVLVHEMAHHIHLIKPIDDHTTTTTPFRTDWFKMVANMEDEAQILLYLGGRDAGLTYREAMYYMRSILNQRIKDIYTASSRSPAYGWWRKYIRHSYAFTNHKEFWAEASESYIVGWSNDRFPDREWIRSNDPALYKLLGEVWSDLDSQPDVGTLSTETIF
ncbi:unnamed protein product [Ectocarpus sp. 12 AP-2014]